MDLRHLRVLRLSPSLIGFYDGRVPGLRFAPESNWVDDGALSLGICSYALIDGTAAIVYDTHLSVEHALAIRRELERLGVRHIVVVLSHWHLDHVAGTEAFADCEIVASRLTRDLLARWQAAIEAGTSDEGPPAISPLVLPTTVFEGQTWLTAGKLRVAAVQFDIHSADGVVLHLPDQGLLLAGDTVEDTVTYVSEPESLETHIEELERLRRLHARRIYPNHGSPRVLEASGYGEGLIRATQSYIRDLLRVPRDPALAGLDLRTFVAASLDAGWITYYEPYERVHQGNLAEVTRVTPEGPGNGDASGRSSNP
jgi:cyclase